ncbi:MAG: GlmL-related ornithine degradation protein [Eubacteriales bacterium]|nr:GlmL-related ornithine degradation protein [Eubacteriales bacterium]
MTIDALVAEIGSTTTVINAFDRLDSDEPVFLGQGQAPTTVEAGDVSQGLQEALASLRKQLGVSELSWRKMLASSSAAGGLRMTVHGLVYDMTVRAAREACLGSGGVLKYVTSGKMRKSDLRKIEEIRPNIIFVAGGTDYGERDTALFNVELLMQNFPDIPLVYAGNIANHEDIADLAQEYGVRIHITENVYPSLDELNILPARGLIHEVFQENIVHSPGMEHIRDLVDGAIMPTPGAVMEAAMLLQAYLGDLLVMDIGGATTDLHSVAENNPNNVEYMLQGEPFAKRTVEGDLGVFVNRFQVYEQFSDSEKHQAGDLQEALAKMPKIPQTTEEIKLAESLAHKAAALALERHVGYWTELYTVSGMQRFIKGKDLSGIRYAIGTGGALTRLPQGGQILRQVLEKPRRKLLLPNEQVEVALDHDYIMASLGVLSTTWPQAALRLLMQSLRLDSREQARVEAQLRQNEKEVSYAESLPEN